MIKRYENPTIKRIWSDSNKTSLWQTVELAVIQARVNLKRLPNEIGQKIFHLLKTHPIDLRKWKQIEEKTHHDLAAFIIERRQHLPKKLQLLLHQDMTSYDTEESALVSMLLSSLTIIGQFYQELAITLIGLARKYRYTPMMGRTHGQTAEVQSFGKRVLTWYVALKTDFGALSRLKKENLRFSKLSGAVGSYHGIDAELEKEALKLLKLEAFYGATQIIPRNLYAPIASALGQMVMTLAKIASDIELGARSGCPLYHEPFSRKQMGSSVMPHKKNTIISEQMKGMSWQVQSFVQAIVSACKTFEERDIGQSCVERMSWPDLFHLTVHCLKRMNKVLSGLVVYPDNMILEIKNTRGCFASATAKSFLAERGVKFGLTANDVYRIVQLAVFNAFEPIEFMECLRNKPPASAQEAQETFETFTSIALPEANSIQNVIAQGDLKVSPQLVASPEEVEKWNLVLKRMFNGKPSSWQINQAWKHVFSIDRYLKTEDILFRKILGGE